MEDIIKINKNDGLSYTGIVTVSVYDNKRLVSQQVSKNTGGEHLFKYLALCLAGDYTGASSIRPWKIALYGWSSDEQTEPKDDNKISNLVSCATTPIVAHYEDDATNDSEKITGYSTTFHFVVPSARIFNTSVPLKSAVLFDANANAITEIENNFCALYTLNDAVDLSEVSSNFIVTIDWKLIVVNGNPQIIIK